MVTLFSTGCPKCCVLKKKMDQNGIEYIENNSVEDMLYLGISAVPVLFVDNIRMEFKDAVDWVNRKQGDLK